MTKLILIAIAAIAPLVIWGLKRWMSATAEKDRLLKKIRDYENKMEKYPVGSADYNRLRTEWLQLNKRWGDLAGRE